jgi:uncharacterized protein (TIGR01777 family)
MIIAISGANGFIGKELSAFFQSKGNEIRRIPRIHAGMQADDLIGILSHADVVINLAGSPIIGRWNDAYKKTLYESRTLTTRRIVEAIGLLTTKPKLFISASAVGIYHKNGLNTETNYIKANDYLAEICSAWEAEANQISAETRVAIIRLGIVLGNQGGALKRMMPIFKIGLGGKIGDGKQGFSWMHIVDLLKAIEFICDNEKMSGVFNFTAPEVVDNAKFTKVLAKVLNRPAIFTVPVFALKLMFGEGVIAVAGGQFALPEHLQQEGFLFSYPCLEDALKEIVS